MIKLGFYIIHNLKYKMVCTINVPWNFETNAEDDPTLGEDGPIIGEWTGEQGTIPTEENGIAGLAEGEEPNPDDLSIEQPPRETFGEWFKRYYELVLSKDNKFMNCFNYNRTYVIIAFDKEDVMGLFHLYKGFSYINFEQFDYRVLINEKFPNIRKSMILKDESFGGYDGDEQFQVDPSKTDNSSSCEWDNEHKTLATYPNLIYHLCIGHFNHDHYHKN